MSSFKRAQKSSSSSSTTTSTATRKTALKPGTRLSPSSTSTVITSTGITSLDDLLGGGLPLSCSLVIAAPDIHSAYGELVQKYFIAQGLASGHRLLLIDDRAEKFAKQCMWTTTTTTTTTTATSTSTTPDGKNANGIAGSLGRGDDEDEEDGHTTAATAQEKIKIAWRYEEMKQFQTTVTSSSSDADEYCRPFSLTAHIPSEVIDTAMKSRQLVALRPSEACTPEDMADKILQTVVAVEKDADPSSLTPLRICIPSLGSPHWGDFSAIDILRFLQRLRTIIRTHPHTCLSVTLAPHISSDNWGGSGWIQKVGWLSDAVLTLSAFTANPALVAQFPSHHGFVHIHTLPTPHTFLPASDRFSTLRGLSSSGENNLAFKCTRKRLVIETLHLDLEGGVGERRTTMPASVLGVDGAEMAAGPVHQEMIGSHQHHRHQHHPGHDGGAALEVQIESSAIITQGGAESDGGAERMIVGDTATMPIPIPPTEAISSEQAPSLTVTVATGKAKKVKTKKKVAFHSEQPDLYDF